MKLSCQVIRDLLPLYAEDLAGGDTRALVEEHLSSCAACAEQLEAMKSPASTPQEAEILPLKRIKRSLTRRRVEAAALAALLVFALLGAVFAYLTAPQYLPYAEDLFALTEAEDGAVLLTLREDATRYGVQGGGGVYHISAWRTLWDQYFSKHGLQNIVLRPEGSESLTLFYSANDGSADTLIHGKNPTPNGGVIPLPRLVMVQYFLLAAAAAAVLALLLFLLRRNQSARRILEAALPVPIAYLLGHLCVLGLQMTTYSAQLALSQILLVALPLYLASLLLFRLLRKKRG